MRLYTNGTIVVAYVIRIMTEKPLLCWVRQKKTTNGLSQSEKSAALSLPQLQPQSEISLMDGNTVLHSLPCRATYAYDGVNGNYGPKDGAGGVLKVRRRVEHRKRVNWDSLLPPVRRQAASIEGSLDVCFQIGETTRQCLTCFVPARQPPITHSCTHTPLLHLSYLTPHPPTV